MSLRSTLLWLFSVAAGLYSGTAMAQSLPVAPIKSVTDRHHGLTVTDDYRYMEDFQNDEVQTWVKAQAQFTQKTLQALPGRAALLARIQELDAGLPYTISAITRLPSGNLFYFKQLAGENVAKLYARDAKTQQERLLIDPDTFPKQHPDQHFTLSFYRAAPDGTKVLYGFAASGSEQTSLKIFDVTQGRDLPDTIDRLEAEYAPPYWFPDSRSFVYSRRRLLADDAPATEGYKFTQAFQHTLGEAVESDRLLLANGVTDSPKLAEMDFPAVILPIGSEWAIGQIKHGDETDITLYAARRNTLGTPDVKWVKVCDRADLVTGFDVRGDEIYLRTAHQSPRFKIVKTSLNKPDFANATTVVAPGEYVVDDVAVAQDALYVGILAGVPEKILRLPFDGQPQQTLPLPADEPSGNVLAVRADLPGALVSTRSWSRAGNLYQYDPKKQMLVPTGLVPRGKFDLPEGITSTEVLVTSHDGVKVPLSIVHRADIELDGSHPTFLAGYGAYGFTMSMRYDPIRLAWLERGGVLAYAHVRGGGAFGKEWHHAGRKLTKPNTWKDFIACGEYLVKAGYTSPGKLAGEGGSAGGILIGRAITERPDLFAAARISVGCTDMLRFETTMNGPPNVPEFGTISKPDEFQALLTMSTLHQIRDGVKYPAVLFTHGANDPRVEPWQSAKSAARFQAASSSGKPVLLRIDYQAGHGIGSTRTQRLQELADVWSFLLWQFGDTDFQPAP